MAKFTYEEVAALEQFKQNVVEAIKTTLGNELTSEQTTDEQDKQIAEKIYVRLMEDEFLDLPERSNSGLATGGPITHGEVTGR